MLSKLQPLVLLSLVFPPPCNGFLTVVDYFYAFNSALVVLRCTAKLFSLEESMLGQCLVGETAATVLYRFLLGSWSGQKPLPTRWVSCVCGVVQKSYLDYC